MNNKNKSKLTVIAGLTTALISTSALAGGYNRGSANLDGLFGDDFGINTGVTYVSPGRSYDKVSGVVVVNNPVWVGTASPPAVVGALFSQTDMEFGEDFTVPYFSIGGQISENLNCVGSYAQPYGVHSQYSGDFTFHIKETKLSSEEFGLTCAANFDAGKGNAIIFGGIFHETVKFYQSRTFASNMLTVSTAGAVNFGDSTIDISSDDLGYRMGVGYEIPKIALKATLTYRSATEHDFTGTFGNTPFTAIFAGRGDFANAGAASGIVDAGASGSATLPQNIELKFQSGVAPSWLAFGAIKWTDWSVVEEINLADSISGAEFTDIKAYFRDGWTITGGVAHRINEKFAVSGSVTWDRGVSSGWDTFSDTWSFAGGVSIKAAENFEIRAGGAAIYLTDGEKTKNDPTSTTPYTASSPNEWGYALSLSANVKF